MRSLRAVVALVFSILLIPSASAHTQLVSSNPAAEAKLSEFPTEVSLTFSEDLLLIGEKNPNQVEVLDPSGKLISGGVTLSGSSITVPVGITGNGEYKVKYRVAAQDGHVVEGDYLFNVESPIAIAQPIPISKQPAKDESGPNLLVRGVEFLLFAALIFILLRRAKS
mgnify:FL=1